jgi:hypothetical protein
MGVATGELAAPNLNTSSALNLSIFYSCGSGDSKLKKRIEQQIKRKQQQQHQDAQ